MEHYQRDFIELCLRYQVLRFGDFTLKSGRISPYFFNAGFFNDGTALARLGYFYAAALQQSQTQFDLLFGPAYKGISLASATAIALANDFEKNVGVCFNRKEVKDHGEGGNLIGAPLQGRVVIIDDVITAGTAINESMQILKHHPVQLTGIVLALDRQEKGTGQLSAVQEVSERYQVTITSIINFQILIEYLTEKNMDPHLLSKMQAYQQQYGVRS